jgi:hypothetical protein
MSNVEESETIEKISAMKELLDNSLLSLPVNLINLVGLSSTNPPSFIFENTLSRLIVVLLNEQDNRISDKVSLFQ